MDCYIKPERCELREGGHFYACEADCFAESFASAKGLAKLRRGGSDACLR